MKLSRKAIEEGLKDLPIEAILGQQVAGALTPKQKAFARKVAQGKSKAQAYREAYNPNPAPSTLVTTPYKVAADPRVQREIEAYTLAIEAEKYRTPAALRSLVIQTLTQTLIDPDTKPAVKLQAAKILGTVTEVAAFTERKEVRTISSSDDARAKVMSELKALLISGATDANIIEADADSLLRELAAPEAPDADAADGQGATPPTQDPPDAPSGVPLP